MRNGDRKKEKEKKWRVGGRRLATVSPTFDLLHDSFSTVILVKGRNLLSKSCKQPKKKTIFHTFHNQALLFFFDETRKWFET